MIVMIFVSQNNFLNGPGISDRLLGFYPMVYWQNHNSSLVSQTHLNSFERTVLKEQKQSFFLNVTNCFQKRENGSHVTADHVIGYLAR